MEQYSKTATDDQGNIVNDALVTVTVASSGAIATVYDKNGDELDQPFKTGYDRSKGEVEFQAANNLYTITVSGNPAASKVNQALFDINEATTTGDINASSVELSAVSETFPGIGAAVAISNIYEPWSESGWPMMMGDKSWYDEEGYGVDGDYHGALTTAERDALTPSQGDVCYNSTTTQFEKYNGSSWATTYRGPKREFPARAVAVAEADKVVIYDLTQSEPVMWMVFAAESGDLFYSSTSTITSVELRGGRLFRGATGHDLHIANLLEDNAERYGTAGVAKDYLGNLAERNDAKSWGGITMLNIVDRAVNDISTTQLDNAPVDEYGVKAVTWAVATDGGVSVGRTDGNVWDITTTLAERNYCNAISFLGNTLYFIAGTSTVSLDYVYGFASMPSADVSIPFDTKGAADFWYNLTAASSGTNAELVICPDGGSANRSLGGNAFGTDTMLTLLKENLITPAEGMVNYLTTNYQSGWMVGDVELALSGNSLADRGVAGTTVTDNGTATFAAVNSGDLQSTAASGGTLTAPVTTGGECYGWEKVTGVWYFRERIADWAGVSEAAGTLTIADGTEFTLLCYTNTTATAADLDFIEKQEKPQFNSGALNQLGGSSNNIASIAWDDYKNQLKVQSGDYLTTIQNSTVIDTEASNDTLVAALDGMVVKG